MARKYTPFQKIIGEQNADKLEFYGGLKNVIITEKIHLKIYQKSTSLNKIPIVN